MGVIDGLLVRVRVRVRARACAMDAARMMNDALWRANRLAGWLASIDVAHDERADLCAESFKF